MPLFLDWEARRNARDMKSASCFANEIAPNLYLPDVIENKIKDFLEPNGSEQIRMAFKKSHGKNFNIIESLESKKDEWVSCNNVIGGARWSDKVLVSHDASAEIYLAEYLREFDAFPYQRQSVADFLARAPTTIFR